MKDGGYIADIPNLDACSTFGNTPAEALAEVQIANAAWLEAARANGSRSHRLGPTGNREL